MREEDPMVKCSKYVQIFSLEMSLHSKVQQCDDLTYTPGLKHLVKIAGLDLNSKEHGHKKH